MTKLTRRNLAIGGTALGVTASLIPGLTFGQTAAFRIGALCSVTGSGGLYGAGMQKAIQFAAVEVNDAGGAAGRKLEIFAEDDQTQPEAGVLAAKKLIEVNQVQAIVGTWSSGVTLAVIPMTLKADIIEMNTSGAPEISTVDDKDLVWRFHPTNDRLGAAFAIACRNRGFTRPALMALNNAYGIGVTQAFKASWEVGGGKVVESVVYEPKRTSYRSEIQKILAAKPDVVIMGSYLPDQTIISKEFFQFGGPIKMIMPSWSGNEQLVAALGKEVTEGIISVAVVPNEKAPSFANFAERYQKATGNPGSTNVFAAMAYDMIISIALAMEAAGPKATTLQINSKIRDVCNPPGQKVYTFAEGKKALAAGKINYEGASGKLDFDKLGDVVGDFGIFTISDGKLTRAETVSL